MSRSNNNQGSGPTNRSNEQLASEYALGILTNEDKNEAEFLLVNDPSFRLMVEEWQERLAPTKDEVGEVSAPETVWREVESQLFGDTDKSASKSFGFWSNLVFWRRLSFASIAAVVILFSIVALRVGEPQSDSATKSGFVAALNLAEDKPTFLVQVDVISGVLNIRATNLTDIENRVPELWLIPEGGAPLSLGIIFADGNTALNITPTLLSDFKSGATLAISLEPVDGAPDGKPMGAIIATGSLQII
ncbi:MAG: anti-sigma factor [Rhizobiaceae bacterium]